LQLDPERAGDKEKLNVQWEFFGLGDGYSNDTILNKSLQESKKLQFLSPTKKDLLCCTLIYLESDADVFVVGLAPRNPNANFHLGLKTFYDVGSPFMEDSDEDIRRKSKALDVLLKSMPKGGIEAGRSGGAQGPFNPNSPGFKALLKYRGKTPRAGRAVLWIGVNSPVSLQFVHVS
jgi:hypothetical protein